MAKVYVADDEKNIRELIATFLREQGLEVEIFETGDQLLLRFMEEEVDVVILDVMMPGTNGVEIANMLRKRSDVPIILLTARDSDADFVKGFSAGADDYFTKPFSPLKLSLRVKAILARQPKASESSKEMADVLTYESLTLSEKERVVTYDNQVIKLTNTEFELLKVLMEHAEEAVSRDDLLHQIWGYESGIETRVTDDTIKRLRKKLRGVESHVLIETVWGYGFKLTKK
jgi:DNA-binding response OmpR family regulator